MFHVHNAVVVQAVKDNSGKATTHITVAIGGPNKKGSFAIRRRMTQCKELGYIRAIPKGLKITYWEITPAGESYLTTPEAQRALNRKKRHEEDQ